MQAEIRPVRRIMGRLAKGSDLLGALEEQCRVQRVLDDETGLFLWARDR